MPTKCATLLQEASSPALVRQDGSGERQNNRGETFPRRRWKHSGRETLHQRPGRKHVLLLLEQKSNRQYQKEWALDRMGNGRAVCMGRISLQREEEGWMSGYRQACILVWGVCLWPLDRLGNGRAVCMGRVSLQCAYHNRNLREEEGWMSVCRQACIWCGECV